MRRLFADTTPLQQPDFRRLWCAGIPTVTGVNLTIFAVPVQLCALTESSAYVGLAGVFGLVPLVVFGLWGGAWADAMDRGGGGWRWCSWRAAVFSWSSA